MRSSCPGGLSWISVALQVWYEISFAFSQKKKKNITKNQDKLCPSCANLQLQRYSKVEWQRLSFSLSHSLPHSLSFSLSVYATHKSLIKFCNFSEMHLTFLTSNSSTLCRAIYTSLPILPFSLSLFI